MALIILDYDGVLADTLVDLLQFGQAACDELGIRHVVTRDDLLNLEEMSFASYGRACEVPEPRVDSFVRICLKRFAEKQSPPAIFNGLKSVVSQLAINHTLAIVTTNSSPNVNAFLREHGLDGCVRAVYGVDSPGSKAQKILLARDRFPAQERRDAVFMVGDSSSDIRAAREASATSIAVAWGHQRLSSLLRADPDHVAHSPRDLLEIIGQ